MDFFFLYNGLFYLYWYVYFLLRMRVVRCVMRQYFVSRNSRTKNKETPSLNRDEASPPPPLRMERGVNSIVCKQRGRFLDVKEASLRCDGTLFSNGEGRFLLFTLSLLRFVLLCYYVLIICHSKNMSLCHCVLNIRYQAH